jgi:hypothetical protein
MTVARPASRLRLFVLAGALMLTAAAHAAGDRFVYEKALLDDWLRKIANR